MSTIDAVTQQLLTSGSRWIKMTPGKEPTYSTVLAITNEGTSERVQQMHPMQVVFVTEDYRVLSQTVDSFIKGREFVDIDDAVESVMDSLLSEPEEEEDDIDIDSVDLPESIDLSEDDDTTQPQTNQITNSSITQSMLSLNVGRHAKATALENAFCDYAEAPYPATGDTLHSLKFKLSEELDLEDISKAFGVTDPNSIQEFEVITQSYMFSVTIDSFITVMFASDGKCNYGILYVTTSGDFRVPITEQVAELESHIPDAHASVMETTSVQDATTAVQDATTAVQAITTLTVA